MSYKNKTLCKCYQNCESRIEMHPLLLTSTSPFGTWDFTLKFLFSSFKAEMEAGILENFFFLVSTHFGSSEKAVAPHSITLAWQIPWMEKPGRLQSMGSRRVRHDWATSLWLFTFMLWRRKWQPTPVFLSGESRGCWSLVGCRLWSCTVGHNWSDLAAAAFCFIFSWKQSFWFA